MNIREVIYNSNDFIFSLNQAVKVPFLITEKPFDKVRKIISNQGEEWHFDEKKNHSKIKKGESQVIAFDYYGGRLMKVFSKSWVCEYEYKNEIIKIVIFNIRKSKKEKFGVLLFTLNPEGQVIKKEIYNKWYDDKFYLDEIDHYKYVDGRFVQKSEFGPKDYDQINFDPIYNGKYALAFVNTYEYHKRKDDTWKVSQFVEDIEDNKKTKFREYVFNKFDDLEYFASYNLSQKMVSEIKYSYQYDNYKNWIYKKELVIESDTNNKQKINEVKRQIEYYKGEKMK